MDLAVVVVVVCGRGGGTCFGVILMTGGFLGRGIAFLSGTAFFEVSVSGGGGSGGVLGCCVVVVVVSLAFSLFFLSMSCSFSFF